ncbi:MAG: anti-sigma factor [Flavobacteriaceae bacterium]
MNYSKLLLLCLLVSGFVACDNDDEDPDQDLVVQLSNLPTLNDGFQYEGWIIVDGAAISTGTFDATGNVTTSIDRTQLEDATRYVLTIEPDPDPSANPSSTHILAGDFNGNVAALTIGHSAALGSDFTDATGKYILATPTNGADTDENSGVWWLDNSNPPAVAGLSLPDLADGWKYEGWAVIDGTPVSTGTFTRVDAADEADEFSGDTPGPAYPGEDFLVNAPDGLTFPTDLSEANVVISIEPDPDDSALPFFLKPLAHQVPANAEDHMVFDMENNIANTLISGTATKR